MPVMCNHCDDAPCMKAAKGGAITQRADGIVIIDPKKSKGQKEIVDACPYGAIYWNEEEQIPQAWFFDAHLLDKGWTKTRIEQCCPTDVFRSVKVEDREMQRIREDEDLEVLKPEIGSKPRVYYKNMHLMTKCFCRRISDSRRGGHRGVRGGCRSHTEAGRVRGNAGNYGHVWRLPLRQTRKE